jgi:hypothetical protein
VALSRLHTAFLLPLKNLKSSALSLRFPSFSSFSIGWKISALCDNKNVSKTEVQRETGDMSTFHTPFAKREI